MIDIDIIMEKISEIGSTYVIVAGEAVILLILGWIAARWIAWAVRRALTGRRHIDQMLVGFFASAIRYGVLAFVIIAVLARLGIQTASLIAVLGAVGLAIGFALRDTLAHVAAGILLLTIRPFGIGDYVEVGGIAGKIDEIRLFSTAMNTSDNVHIIVPNSQLWGDAIRNYNTNSTRRIDITVGIGYGDAIGEAIAAAQAVVAGDSRVLQTPAPDFLVTGLGDSAVDLLVRVWCKREDNWGAKCDLTRNLKEAFERAGIEIPFPQRVVHMAAAS
ncbi:MAG: mechanosensitive ion channel [Alphaproteobacteria bacterium]|nr:mechanosensitive ion channel [Alphaproteobacteria bacterium]